MERFQSTDVVRQTPVANRLVCRLGALHNDACVHHLLWPTIGNCPQAVVHSWCNLQRAPFRRTALSTVNFWLSTTALVH